MRLTAAAAPDRVRGLQAPAVRQPLAAQRSVLARRIRVPKALSRDTIRHPGFNPSTMRVLNVRGGEVSDAEATVFTQEYWCLRRWSLIESSYVYVYNETNRQRYVLTRAGGRWLVDTNIYPPPQTTTALRRPRGGSARR